MKPALQLAALSKGYGTATGRTEVLRDIHLSIDPGEFVAIVGYSGAGKTTLINLMAGLAHPDSGSVALDGAPVTGPGPDRGIVFQNYSLLPWLTVAGNIRLAVDQCFPDWPASRRERHVDHHISLVNLMPARDRKPAQLSGGMRQRVSVARALAMEPRILLLDEPFGALDALTRATLQDELGRIWQLTRTTVVLITNDPDEGIYLADRILPLGAGPSATLGPSLAIDLPRPRDRRALGHDPRFKAIRRELVEYLVASRSTQRSGSVTRKLVLPDIEPEDLDRPRPLVGGRRGPIRRSEIHRETVEVP